MNTIKIEIFNGMSYIRFYQYENIREENERLKEKIKILEAKNFEKCPFRYFDMGCDYCDWKDRDLKYEVKQ